MFFTNLLRDIFKRIIKLPSSDGINNIWLFLLMYLIAKRRQFRLWKRYSSKLPMFTGENREVTEKGIIVSEENSYSYGKKIYTIIYQQSVSYKV